MANSIQRVIQVLLVEDNALDAELLKERLKDVRASEIRLNHVRTLKEAIDALSKDTYDVTLLDMNLPDSTGFETLIKIRKEFPETAVVTLTGFDDDEFALRAVGAGAQDYLYKNDLDTKHLLRSLRYAAERNEMLAALKQSENRYRVLIENMQGMICTHDLEGNIISVNLATARSLGYQPDELMGKNLGLVIQESHREQMKEYLLRIQDHLFDEGLMYVVTKDGENRTLQYKNILFGEGGSQYVIGFAQDITERIRAEEELKEANLKLSRSVYELQQRTREVMVLSRMTELLMSCESSGEAHEVIVGSITQLFDDSTRGGIFQMDSSRSNFEIAATWGGYSPKDQSFAPNQCWALRMGKPYRVDNSKESPACQHLKNSTPSSYLCIPLMAHGTAFGLLHIQPRSDSEFLTLEISHKQRLAVSIAEQVSLALSTLRMRDELRDQAIRDPLTGLFNRRYIEEWLERELLRSVRYKRNLSIAFIDIDHFKNVNDTYGHPIGDETLRQLGALLTNKLRRTDLKGRFGGEEFVIVYPETNLDDAMQQSERIRKEVKTIVIHTEEGTLQDISISIGVASCPEHGSSMTELLSSADRALYRAKNEGRDRVVSA